MSSLGSWRATVLRAISLLFVVSLVALAWSSTRLHAHEGHDHGPEPETGAVPTSPRVAAVSDNYQFVGIVEGEVLVIYLDRAADNAPVSTATIEVTLNGETFKAVTQLKETYEITAPLLRKPGKIEVVVAIKDGATSDLLVGSLPIPGDDSATPSSGVVAWVKGVFGLVAKPAVARTSDQILAPSPSWGWLGWLTAAMLVGAVGFGGAKFARSRKSLLVFAIMISGLFVNPSADAGPGHDHGPDLSASTGNAPARRPDGTIFLPKPTQRLLQVRTLIVEPKTVLKTVRFSGRIVANPNFSGVVQSTIQGRYQAPEAGVPALGTRVAVGDSLGRITPSFASIDASNMLQQQGDLDQQISIVQNKLRRQEQLLRSNAVALALVDETRLSLAGLIKRRTELLGSKVQAEELRAPVSGVIAAVKVVSGQVVSLTDQIFHIVDPNRVLVEALVFDQVNPDQVGEASALFASGTVVKLKFLGRSRALQQQYTLMQFEIAQGVGALDIGVPVTITAQTGTAVTGVVLPRAALAQAPNGQTVVFLHTEPESFVPRAVRSEPFDGQHVLVTGGLEKGDKVVVQNAPLVNQVR